MSSQKSKCNTEPEMTYQQVQNALQPYDYEPLPMPEMTFNEEVEEVVGNSASPDEAPLEIPTINWKVK